MPRSKTPDVTYCPRCGRVGRLVESDEIGTDYHVVGQTYRCKECGWGFGFVCEPGEFWKKGVELK